MQRAADIDAGDLGVRFVAGDADLREVYEAYGPLVFGICRRTLPDAAAADVTQEVFLGAWRGRQQFDATRGTMAMWLVGITKRRVIDHLRREQRHDERRAAGADQATIVTDDAVDAVADRLLLADALQRLPDRARTVMELAFLRDLTHHEVAERTGLPLGTVKSDIRRGLQRVRELLAGDASTQADGR